MSFSLKKRYDIDDLLEIMKLLRSPDGCPWDKVQTHQSIRENMIEETYELLDAIDSGDVANLREELGDVLLQVVFHSRMAQEDGQFDFGDVCDEVCQKLVVRHPHVFGSVQADSTDDALKNWHGVKQKLKGQKTPSESMESVPKGMPALIRARKVQKRATLGGFDLAFDSANAEEALDRLEESTAQLRDALKNGSREEAQKRYGDLLFAAVNISRKADLEAETALAHASDRFIERFRRMEKLAADRSVDLVTLAPDALCDLWSEAEDEA